MFDFIGYILKAPLGFAKKFLNSPISTMFYGLVSKWYLVTMTLSVIVIYWVISGLNKAGVIELAFRAFADAGKQIKGFAQNCTPLITDINAFLKCTVDTPEYTGDEITNAFEIDVKKDMSDYVNHPVNHEKIYLLSPYDLQFDNNNSSTRSSNNQDSVQKYNLPLQAPKQ